MISIFKIFCDLVSSFFISSSDFDCSPYLEKIFFAVAIGGKNGKIRCEIAAFLKSYGLVPYTIIHNSALLAPSVELGEGAQILQGVNLLTGTKVGDYSIVEAATV